MVLNRFYVDACIYLNVWRMECGSRKLQPFWEGSKIFFEKYDDNFTIFYYSGFVLREIRPLLSSEEYQDKRMMFNSALNYVKLRASDFLIARARKLESQLFYEISFYDIIHMLLAEENDAVLVTRDRALLKIAKSRGTSCGRPEDFL